MILPMEMYPSYWFQAMTLAQVPTPLRNTCSPVVLQKLDSWLMALPSRRPGGKQDTLLALLLAFIYISFLARGDTCLVLKHKNLFFKFLTVCFLFAYLFVCFFPYLDGEGST